ncbi:MAG: SHOCT domain-containing protein [Thermoplasmata archaeon]
MISMTNSYEKHMKMLIFGIVSIVAVIVVLMVLSTLFYGNYGYYNGYYGMGMMFGPGIWMMVFGLIFVALIIGIVIWAIYGVSEEQNHDRQSALDILEKRYARGEISRDEYLKTREDLKKY